MLLSAIAIAAAWTIFRFNADASLKNTLTAARARLLAVKEGVVDGWGVSYMQKTWPAAEVAKAQVAAEECVRDPEQWMYQVIPVSTTPLDVLATATEIGDAVISPSTVGSAGTAVWQLTRINHAIHAQTQFNAAHAVDRRRALAVGDGDALEAIARAAGEINGYVHSMLGEGAAGWYAELRDRVKHDLWKVERNERFCARVICLRPWLVGGDVAVACLLAWAILDALL
jgi:hypothetical protein